VLGLQLCIAQHATEVPAAPRSGEQAYDDALEDERYDLVTYEHRRSIEADYHPVDCLANQPQVREPYILVLGNTNDSRHGTYREKVSGTR